MPLLTTDWLTSQKTGIGQNPQPVAQSAGPAQASLPPARLAAHRVSGRLERTARTSFRAGCGEMLAELAASSLVATRELPGGPRYRMLTVVRTQASRMLAESGRTHQVGQAHARWVATLTRQAAADWTGPAAAAALQRLHSHSDFMSALRWALGAGQL